MLLTYKGKQRAMRFATLAGVVALTQGKDQLISAKQADELKKRPYIAKLIDSGDIQIDDLQEGYKRDDLAKLAKTHNVKVDEKATIPELRLALSGEPVETVDSAGDENPPDQTGDDK